MPAIPQTSGNAAPKSLLHVHLAAR
jgi:hypothetical protein